MSLRHDKSGEAVIAGLTRNPAVMDAGSSPA
jgi:hypothetical protein